MNNYDQIDLLKVKEEVCKYAFLDDAKDYILNE